MMGRRMNCGVGSCQGEKGAWLVARIGRTIVGVAGSKDATSLASKAAIGRGWRCHKIINK